MWPIPGRIKGTRRPDQGQHHAALLAAILFGVDETCPKMAASLLVVISFSNTPTVCDTELPLASTWIHRRIRSKKNISKSCVKKEKHAVQALQVDLLLLSTAAIPALAASSTNISASLWWNHFYCIHPIINFMALKRRGRAASLSLPSVCLKMRRVCSCCCKHHGDALLTELEIFPLGFNNWFHLVDVLYEF
ncbi:hypothetical protein ATANTOWER_019314 [Ataeniobius toweri]|uniref:Uncharacterized protein n=1 Tax=Ataeniobius toweri TaxID=208326 RepID=A0ABU7C6X1_9TELE|nr:hypothetical protein [Ataeniobius toweri]